MPFTDIAPPAPAKAPGSGFSLGLQESKARGQIARLTIRGDMQERFFGKSVAGLKFSAQVGRGADEGRLRLVLDEQGDLEAKASVKGSVFIAMKAWDLLPKGKRPAGACEVQRAPSNHEVILVLPGWCKPSGVDGKIAQEHALPRINRR